MYTSPQFKKYSEQQPVVTINNLLPSIMHWRTGFSDINELLCFAAVVCCGDLLVLTRTTSFMTWLEEWFFYFEMVYGHSMNQWVDFSFKYQMATKVLCQVYRTKLALVLKAQNCWPLYVTNDEDIRLHKSSWNMIFDPNKKEQIVMHDNTDVHLVKPKDPALQQSLYSQYYAGCVAKGGITLQLCGWTVTWELCTGGIDDTAYVNATRIFETQQSLALHDVTSSNTFINFFDHGYCVLLDAQQHGGQLCVQPVFSKWKRKFNTRKVLYLAAVATVRSGNERAVKNAQ